MFMKKKKWQKQSLGDSDYMLRASRHFLLLIFIWFIFTLLFVFTEFLFFVCVCSPIPLFKVPGPSSLTAKWNLSHATGTNGHCKERPQIPQWIVSANWGLRFSSLKCQLKSRILKMQKQLAAVGFTGEERHLHSVPLMLTSGFSF